MTALVMSVIAVALVGTGTAVAVNRTAGSGHSTSAAAGPSSSPSPPTPGGIATIPPTSPATTPSTAQPSGSQKSLQTLLAKTFAKALAQHTVHSVAHNVGASGDTATFDDLDGRTSGVQHITVHGGHVEIRVVGKTTYFTGDERGMEQYFQFTKDEIQSLNGQWLSLISGQAGYQEVTAGVTLASTLEEDRIGGTLHREAAKTIDGQPVFGISGRAIGEGSPKRARATLWIGTISGLPVEYDAVNTKTSLSQAFSDWGKPIRVVTPAKVFNDHTLSG